MKNKCLEGLSKTHRKTLLLLNFTKNKTILNSYPHRVCNKSIFLGINQCPHSNPHSKVCTICSKQYGVCSVMKHLLVKIFRKRIWKNDLLLSLYSAKSKLLSKTSARIFSRKWIPWKFLIKRFTKIWKLNPYQKSCQLSLVSFSKCCDGCLLKGHTYTETNLQYSDTGLFE